MKGGECPSKDTNSKQRAKFVNYDVKSGFRSNYKEVLEGWLKYKNMNELVTVALGGSTSFDIYPTGWDKTYALRHFPKEEWEVYFVGDRCYPNGNDYEIYKALEPEGRAFSTGSPEETVEIIDTHLLRLIPTE